MVDSDSEDDLGVRLAPKKAPIEMATTKRGRTPANRVTKPVQKSTRRANAMVASAVEAEGARPALAEMPPNSQPAATTGRGRKKAALPKDSPEALASPPASDEPKAKATRGRPRRTKPAQPLAELEIPDSAQRGSAAPVAVAARRGRRPAAAKQVEEPPEEMEIPETQDVDPMELDQEEDSQMDVAPAGRRSESAGLRRLPLAPLPVAAPPPRKLAAVPDLEQNEVSLRRRLGDLTKKFESLEARYRDLREIGVIEAERNFDRLKRQGEEKTKGIH